VFIKLRPFVPCNIACDNHTDRRICGPQGRHKQGQTHKLLQSLIPVSQSTGTVKRIVRLQSIFIDVGLLWLLLLRDNNTYFERRQQYSSCLHNIWVFCIRTHKVWYRKQSFIGSYGLQLRVTRRRVRTFLLSDYFEFAGSGLLPNVRTHTQLCPRIHWFISRCLPRPEKNGKVKETNGSLVSKRAPSNNGP
jgi:hypothetical protein